MLGVAAYGASIGLALMVLTVHLYPSLRFTEIAVASLVVGTLGGAWLTFLVSALINFLSDEALTISCVIGAVAFVSYLDPFLQALRAALADFKSELPLVRWVVPIMGVFAAAVGPLYASRYLQEDASGQVWTGGSTWADLPIHLHMANSFLHGRNRVVYFDGMHSPVFAGEMMKYPFIPDFHAAALVKFGATMHTAMWLPGAVCFVSFVGLLFLLNLRVVRNAPAAALSVLLVVFAGGFAGVRLWWTNGLTRTLAMDPVQDDVGVNGEVFWFACVPHVLIPQRGATVAYPALLFVMLLAWVAVAHRHQHSRSQTAALIITAAAVAGGLPLVQAHACIAIAMFVGLLFLLEVYRCTLDIMPALMGYVNRTAIPAAELSAAKSAAACLGSWAAAGVVAIAEAWPQIRVLSTGMSAKGFFETKFVLSGGLPGFITSWWAALGPAVFLSLFTGFVLFRKMQAAAAPARSPTPTAVAAAAAAAAAADNTAKSTNGYAPPAPTDPTAAQLATSAVAVQRFVWWCASIAVFAFGNFVLVTPWAKDNVKLLYMWLVPASGFTAHLLVSWFQSALQAQAAASNSKPVRTQAPAGSSSSTPLGLPPTIVLVAVPLVVALMTFSGSLGLVRETNHNHVLYGPSEAAVGKWLIENTRTEAVMLHKDDHRAPSGMLGGRPSLVAYTGWMWSHGYDYGERHRDRDTILSHITKPEHGDATYLLYRWGVKYVVHEASTSKKEQLDQMYLGGHVKRVFQSNRYHVFRVKYDGEPY